MRTRILAAVPGLAVLLSAAFGAFPSATQAASTVVFTDGFAAGYDAWSRVTANGGTVYVTADAAYGTRAGLRLAETSASGSVGYVRRTFASPYQDLTLAVSARVRKEGAIGQGVPLLRVFDTSGARILSVDRRSGLGRVVVTYGGSAHSTSTTLRLGAWARVAARLYINGAFGVLKVTINGRTVLSTGAANLGYTPAGSIQLGNDRSGQPFTLDADAVTVNAQPFTGTINPAPLPVPAPVPGPGGSNPGPTPSPTPNPSPGSPTPAPAAGSGRIARLSAPLTSSKLLSTIADGSVDVIELASGTYTPGTVKINVDRSRPLLIRPAAGATVVFANGSDAAFEFGYGGRAGNITMQGLIFDGYHIGAIGIFWVGNAHDLTLNDMTIRNSSGGGDNSWALYLSTDNGAGAANITANNWVVDGGGRSFGGAQSYHNPNAHGVTLLGWNIRNCTYAIYAQSDATGLDVENWTIDACGMTNSAYLSVVFRNVSGVAKNLHATNSGGGDIQSPMVDGGGNLLP